MKRLVIAPHPDDETIGCGGSILRHIRDGDDVSIIWLTRGELGVKDLPAAQAQALREQEARAAARLLGAVHLAFWSYPDWGVADHTGAIAANLAEWLAMHQPRCVYLPHPRDAHPDHAPVHAILDQALRASRIDRPELRAYEVWTPLPAADYVVDIGNVMLGKMRALRAHRSQLRDFDYVRAVRGLNQYRGAMCGRCRYAEVFQDLSQHSSA